MKIPIGTTGLWPARDPKYVAVVIPPRKRTPINHVYAMLIATVDPSGNRSALGNKGDICVSTLIVLPTIKKETLCIE